MDLKIRAIGACMIAGFPHRYEDSCFHLAMERLRRETGHNLISSIYTFGGFPVTRVLKHLPSRCFATKPDIVVVQFASSDLIVPVRRKHHGSKVSSVDRKVSTAPASTAHQLRWSLRGIIGDLLRLTPVTPPEIYLDTLGRIVRAIAGHQAVPVVLSPFVFGDGRSDRLARACVPRLQQVVAAIPNARYVEVYSALDKYPRRQMLLGDGTHLSLRGQAVVGECLFTALAMIIRDKNPARHRPS
jgi:lysophospholipase L1-like esterase